MFVMGMCSGFGLNWMGSAIVSCMVWIEERNTYGGHSPVSI
jgi:hypothetical protein